MGVLGLLWLGRGQLTGVLLLTSSKLLVGSQIFSQAMVAAWPYDRPRLGMAEGQRGSYTAAYSGLASVDHGYAPSGHDVWEQ